MPQLDSEQEVAAVRAFNRFYTRKLGVLDQQLLKSPYSLSEARVLYELAHREDLSAKEICAELGLDAGYLSRIVQKFEEAGLITSKPLPSDRRQNRLALTARGRQTFTKLERSMQDEVAAIIMEPMQGTAGNVIPPDDFVHAVREIADEFDALLIADEVLTGFGRTGTMWASDQFSLKPDIMTIGKGMGGGFPLSGVASSFELMSAKPFGEPSGSSSSYGGNPLGAAAGLGAVEAIINERLVENSARVGKVMLDALKKLQEKYRFIGDVRGRGLMIGVEMVADRKTKEPLDRAITLALFHEALARGLVTMSYSHVIRINPPLVITEDEALRGVDILDQSFGAIARQFGLD